MSSGKWFWASCRRQEGRRTQSELRHQADRCSRQWCNLAGDHMQNHIQSSSKLSSWGMEEGNIFPAAHIPLVATWVAISYTSLYFCACARMAEWASTSILCGRETLVKKGLSHYICVVAMTAITNWPKRTWGGAKQSPVDTFISFSFQISTYTLVSYLS